MLLKQSTTRNRMFLLVLSSDHVSPATGKSPTVTISKDGAAFAAAGGAVTEVSGGWYKVALTTTDTNTLGDLAYHVTEASSDNTDFVDQVVTNLPGDKIAVTLAAADVTGNLPSDLQTIKTQTVTCSAGVTVNVNVGTTQPLNFTGTAASALVKSDMVDVAGAAVSTTTAQIGVNAVQVNGVATTSVTAVNANIGTTQPVNFSGTGATAYVKGDLEQWIGVAPLALTTQLVQVQDNQLGAQAKTDVENAVWNANVGNHTALNTFGDDHQTVADTNNRIVVLENGLISKTATVNDVGASTTTFNTTLTEPTGFWNDKVLVFTNGALAGQSKVVLSYNNTGGQIVLSEALTAAPANGVQFELLSMHVHPVSQIVTGVWQDTTASDFTTAGSIGKSIFTSGNVPGAANGLSLVGSNMGSVTSVTGNVAGNVSGSVTSVTNPVTLTSAYDFAKGTVAMTESYNADGSPPTPQQAFFVLTQMLTEMSISGTTMTIKKLDGTTTAMTLTLDSSTSPTSVTRTT